ncbi:NAD-dependent succinate-semialdehyde dehydrogenase [Demetria terragena]|uniref:NAD-dependent succinate-semialdehyde dehydrogenase n=1 Tax=Demetria terragena TaxID=63959 RepID=UPI000477CDD9|nr:NAD-dependent succinate-semialdehyde dehydrogenase [Demetria terragena]
MTTYAVTNPATGETVATYPTLTDVEMKAAIDLAHGTYGPWARETTPTQRAELIRKVGDLHSERREDLADTIVREMGKPRAGALEEVDFAADIYRYYADNIDAIVADSPIQLLGGDGSAVMRKAPLGVLIGIMPWNFPYYQVTRFAAPNLLLGNTILLKHAPQCPESAAKIAEIFRDAGVPEGAYVDIRATNDQIAEAVADPRIQGVSVTGSERAGAAVAEVAGRNLKKVALELGGSDPFIVLSTDNLDECVEGAVFGRLDNAGQVCNGAKRFIIVDDLYDDFVEKFTAAMGEVKAGDPTQDDCELGPLSSLTAADRLQEQLDRAVENGAKVALGGTRDGAFFAPTVLTDVTPENPAFQEEFFGPVAMMFRVADEAEAVALANNTRYGLGSYLYTTDPEQADRVANQIEAGMVYVNIIGADSPELPFGGVKRSGTARELGLIAANEFANHKLIRIG